MLKVEFHAKDITDLKLQIQEYGITHLGLGFLKPFKPAPPAEKRKPGRPRKIRPEDLARIEPEPQPTAPDPIPFEPEAKLSGVTYTGLMAAFHAFAAIWGAEEAVSVLGEFGAFNVEEVNPGDYEMAFKRFTEGMKSVSVASL